MVEIVFPVGDRRFVCRHLLLPLAWRVLKTLYVSCVFCLQIFWSIAVDRMIRVFYLFSAGIGGESQLFFTGFP